MSQRVYFNGKILTVPGAYSTIDVSAMTTKGDNDGAKVIAIIGECTGGEPGAVQFFTDPVSARKVLKSGPLLKACEKAWNPVSKTKEGVALGGADTIACIRANPATKGELKMPGDEDEPQLWFKSKDWGEGNAHQIKLQDGTLLGTKKLVIFDQTNDFYEIYDNLGNVFTIAYIGPQQYAELSITKDESNTLYFQTKVGKDTSSAQQDINIKLDPNKFKTMKAFIGKLQTYENYFVAASDEYNLRLKVNDLDLVSKVDIKKSDDLQYYRVTAIYKDMKLTLDTDSTLVELFSYDSTKPAIPNFEYQTLTGGIEGLTPASWVDFFDKLSNLDVTYIVPLTADISIHAELASHVTEMSGNLGKERRAIVGGNNFETVHETIQRARNLASDRIQVVHGGFWDYNKDNELELYPPYILAAQHAGRVAFLEDGESATHDVYRMSAPEYKLEREEVSELLHGGVLAFEFVLGKNTTAQSYVRLVQDLTTDVASTDPVHTERATGALADSINREIREGLDSLLTGKRTSTSDLTSAKNRVISILDVRKRKNHIVDYKGVYVVKNSGVTEVAYSVAPAEPNNFTLITAHYYSQTIEAK